MDIRPQDWPRIKSIFNQALEIDAPERAAFVAAMCADDARVREQVEALLNEHQLATGDSLDFGMTALDAPAGNLNGRTVGTYRIVTLLGAGGMGEVYAAHDVKLDRPVALKVLSSSVPADAERLRRFHAEARAASALNHPHIVVIHDFGAIDGRPFIVTELVEGETLRRRLDGPLPVSAAIDVIIQAASALSAAHARGIVHRDLKPENIMVRPDGYVKVLDFGLAKLMKTATHDLLSEVRTQPGAIMGTPRYMSPEQARGLEMDPRTDVWSLGVVLYEMIAGRPPFTGATNTDVVAAILEREPEPIENVAPHVPEQLASIVRKTLRKNPADRYPTAAELFAALSALKGSGGLTADRIPKHGERSNTSWVRPMAIAALIVVVIAVSASVWRRTRNAEPAVERSAVLVADIENATGDPVFDGTLRRALAVQLEQSPFLRVASDTIIRDTLPLMNRPADTLIVGPVAREICQRNAFKAMLSGSIAALGSRYAIAIDAIDCESGEALARQQVEAASKEEVLTAVGGATDQLRRTLGESLGSIESHNVPLVQATTRSLEALKAYHTAIEMRTRGGTSVDRQILPLLERAIELDPDFAIAHRVLGSVHDNLGHAGLSRRHATRAYELRDRVSDRERLAIVGSYYDNATGETDKAIAAYEVWKKTYPYDPVPANNASLLYGTEKGHYDRAVAEGEEAVRRGPKNAGMIVTLADTYLNSGRVDQARAVLEDGLAQGIVPPGQRTLYSIAFMRGDVAAMRREIERARGKPTEALIRDRVRAGYAFLGQLRQLADTASAAPSVAASIQQAVALFDFGRPAEACAMVERIPQAEREEIVSRTPGERIALIASCSDAAAVRGIIKTLQQAQPSGAIVNGVVIPTMRAVLALKEGRAAAAADELRAVLSFDQTAAGRRAPYLRGLAYRRLHDPASAIVEFRKITEHRYRFALAVQYPVALAELARAYVDNGQLAEAMTAYDEVVAIWKDADAGLPLVEAVRAERESVRRRLTAGTEAALKREAAPAKKSS